MTITAAVLCRLDIDRFAGMLTGPDDKLTPFDYALAEVGQMKGAEVLNLIQPREV